MSDRNAMLRAMTLEEKVKSDFGLDPNIERGGILPLPTRDQSGEIDWTNWRVPEWFYESAKAAALPAYVAEGGQYDLKDVTNMAMALGGSGSVASRAVGGVGDNALGMFAGKINRTDPKDASDTFGKGTNTVWYQDPVSGGRMQVLKRDNGPSSVLELYVPEEHRSQGIGRALQQAALDDNPYLMGQVSSKHAAKSAYDMGRRPYNMPDATLDDVYKIIDEESSINLIKKPESKIQKLTHEEWEKATPAERMGIAQRNAYIKWPEFGPDNTPQQRAEKMGFDVDAYHGTLDDFSDIDPNKFGRSQSLLGNAFYTSTGTKRPSRYASENGQVMPVKIRSEDMIDLSKPIGHDGLSRIAKVMEDAGADVDLRDESLFIKNDDASAFLDDYMPFDVNLKKIRDGFGVDNMTNILKEADYSGVIGAEGAGSNVFANYAPNSIRSRFAAFDPAQADSTKLLAMNPSTSATPAMIEAFLNAIPEEKKKIPNINTIYGNQL